MKYTLAFLAFLSSCIFSFIAGGFYWVKVLDKLPLCFSGVHVVDGDTLRCEGRNIRLYGFDTPEPRPQNTPKGCKKNSVALGKVVSDYVKKLIANAKSAGTLEIIPILTNRGTYKKGRRRRPLITVEIGGKDLADLLKAKDFAADYQDGDKKPDWCAIIDGNSELQALVKARLATTEKK